MRIRVRGFRTALLVGLAAARVQHDIRDWIRSAMRRHEGPIPAFQDRDRLLAIYDKVFAQLKERYGTLHGFDTQALFAFVSGFVNEYVGN